MTYEIRVGDYVQVRPDVQAHPTWKANPGRVREIEPTGVVWVMFCDHIGLHFPSESLEPAVRMPVDCDCERRDRIEEERIRVEVGKTLPWCCPDCGEGIGYFVRNWLPFLHKCPAQGPRP